VATHTGVERESMRNCLATSPPVRTLVYFGPSARSLVVAIAADCVKATLLFMWHRFTESARRVVFRAQEEAQRTGEGYVNSEHMLLGLLREENTAVKVLRSIAAEPDRIRSELLRLMPDSEPPPSQDMTLTPRALRVVNLAYDNARRLNKNYIGSEHILLALIGAGGIAEKVLFENGALLERVLDEVQRVYKEPGEPTHPVHIQAGPSRAKVTHELLHIRQQRWPCDRLALMLLAEGGVQTLLVNAGMPVSTIWTLLEEEIIARSVRTAPQSTPTLEELFARANAIAEGGVATAAHMILAVGTDERTLLYQVLRQLEVDIDDIRQHL
jgi:hypothetical protein